MQFMHTLLKSSLALMVELRRRAFGEAGDTALKANKRIKYKVLKAIAGYREELRRLLDGDSEEERR